MKKLVGIFLTLSTLVFALNFSGRQSLNGVNTRISLFTAPATGRYFIKGTLYLPQLSQGALSPSQVAARVYKNGFFIYSGVSGASGFSLPSVALVTADAITVALSSNASVDAGLNAVTGQVFFGNSY